MGDREEYYIYDDDDVVLDFVDANGATGGVSPVLKTRYLHGPVVDQILAQEELDGSGNSADVLWMLTDHLGSVRDIVNQAGEAVSHVTYDAFGNIVGGTGVLLTRYLYTGREFDTLTGLQYNRNRWYDPTLGRWISEDPIGFAGGDYNLGRYTFNLPTVATDPEGTVVWFVVVGVGAAWWWFTPTNAHAPGTQAEMEHAAALDQARQEQNAINTAIIIAIGGTAGLLSGPAATAACPVDVFAGTGGPAAFGRLIGWGTGPAAATARASSITVAELQAAGITLPVAQYWLNFYQNAVASGQGGATAIERVRLMQRIIELLGG